MRLFAAVLLSLTFAALDARADEMVPPASASATVSPPAQAGPPASQEAEKKSLGRGDFTMFVTAFGGTPRAFQLLDGGAAPAAASIEAAFSLTEQLALKAVLGGMFLHSEGMTSWGFSVGVGADAYLGSSRSALRPVLGGEVQFGRYIAAEGGDTFFVNVGARAGAAYFLTSNLVIRLTAGLDVPVQLKNTVVGAQLVPFELGLGLAF